MENNPLTITKKKVQNTSKKKIYSNVKNYFKGNFLFDLKAGFITSVVALPLAIAFAIASGVSPIMGLYTAIIGGILASSISGSKFSITGPTGAMAVIIFTVVEKHGIEGLILAGFLAGLMQLIMGFLKLGKAVSYIPLPVVSGFTSGIGILILLGQISSAIGINVVSHEFIGDTIKEIFFRLNEINIFALSISLGTILLLVLLPKIFAKNKILKSVPPSIIPLVASVILIYFFRPDISIIGEIPRALPLFHIPIFSLKLIEEMLMPAFTIAMLGAIESLLCAVVCDGMTSTKHDSNKELIAQGVTNMCLPFFGGIPATAAIARSAINIREGARTRISGIIHALFILSYVFIFGSVISNVPKAFLAGILIFVSFKMINFKEMKIIFKISKSDTTIMLITIALTIFTDLVKAVQIGMLLAMLSLFMRMTQAMNIFSHEDYESDTKINSRLELNEFVKKSISVYTIMGPFFFGAMSVFEKKIEEHMSMKNKVIIIKMKNVPFIDSTGVVRLVEFIKGRKKKKKIVLLVRVNKAVEEKLYQNEMFLELMPKKLLFSNTDDAIIYAEKLLNKISRKDA